MTKTKAEAVTVGKIEKHVPPPGYAPVGVEFGWEEFSVGDSKTVKGMNPRAVGVIAAQFCKHSKPQWKFRARPEGDHVRVWRVK